MEDEAVLEAARAIRGYLPELVSEQAADIDALIGQYLDLSRQDPEAAAGRLTELFLADDRLTDWVAQLLADPGLRPPDLSGPELKGFSPLPGGVPDMPGLQQPVPATRYVCPKKQERVWYRRDLGQAVPVCPEHLVAFVPTPASTS